MLKIVALNFFIFFQIFSASAFEIVGIAHVTDGDTLRIEGYRIRLKGIDAPELNQNCEYLSANWECGQAAKNNLVKKLNGNIIICEITKKDRYKRFVGTCFLNYINNKNITTKENINAWLVENGFAISYFTKEYLSEQFRAQENNKGIWNSTFVEPAKFRKLKYKKILKNQRQF